MLLGVYILARTSSKAPPSAEAIRQKRREILQRDRSQADLLRSAWPKVEILRLQFTFDDGTRLPPSTQLHQFNPPARSFYRFPCPFADCSGEYDLSDIVTQTFKSNRGEIHQLFSCEGIRARDRITGYACGLKLDTKVIVQYKKEERKDAKRDAA